MPNERPLSIAHSPPQLHIRNIGSNMDIRLDILLMEALNGPHHGVHASPCRSMT
jgi:hypothetical protein